MTAPGIEAFSITNARCSSVSGAEPMCIVGCLVQHLKPDNQILKLQ